MVTYAAPSAGSVNRVSPRPVREYTASASTVSTLSAASRGRLSLPSTGWPSSQPLRTAPSTVRVARSANVDAPGPGSLQPNRISLRDLTGSAVRSRNTSYDSTSSRPARNLASASVSAGTAQAFHDLTPVARAERGSSPASQHLQEQAKRIRAK